MDEARKPFEYEEESGVSGFLYLFLVMMMSFEIGYGVIALVQLNKVLGSESIFGKVGLSISILYIVFILFTCVVLYKVIRYAVNITKIFLISRAVYLTLSSIIVFVHTLNDKYAIGQSPEQFESLQTMVFMVLVTPLIYTLVFSILWYIYFCRSKRVRKVYFESV